MPTSRDDTPRHAGTVAFCSPRTPTLASVCSGSPQLPLPPPFLLLFSRAVYNSMNPYFYNSIHNYASPAAFGAIKMFLRACQEPLTSLEFSVTSPVKGDRRGRGIYNWPSGQSHWPARKPPKEVHSGIFSICTWHRAESLMFIGLIWKFRWLDVHILTEGDATFGLLIFIQWGENEFYYWAWSDLPWVSRGFSAWETLQNSRKQKQLTIMGNSFFIFKSLRNTL